MSTKSELLRLLDSNCGSFVSGESLARELGISRAAVNKAANALKKSGYDILSRPSQGYLLRDKADLLTEVSVGSRLTGDCRIKVMDTVDSLNSSARGLELGDKPTVLIAGEQRRARDKRGRPFPAPGGSGLYLSLAFKPSFGIDRAQFLTMASALSVAGAIEEVTGINPRVGWVNDLYHDGKRICEIVTEGITNLETGIFHRLILGVNIFCFPAKGAEEPSQDFGCLSREKDSFSRSTLAARVIDGLLRVAEDPSSERVLSEYRRRCFILGKPVNVTPMDGGRAYAARAIDVDERGGLVVEFTEGPRMREMVTITSGEVTLRDTADRTPLY